MNAANPPLQPLRLTALLEDISAQSARIALAKYLVVFSFVWPFFNYQLLDPSSSTEINFLPVFLAAVLVPEIALREKWSIFLGIAALSVAFVWGNETAPLRLLVGILPLHFILNFVRFLNGRGEDLIPRGLAFRALIVFIVFCILQTIDFQFFQIIPSPITEALKSILPRYSGTAYNDFGVRGVQGWASEPSSAALTCFAFSLIAIRQRPERRWRILALFALFLVLNKSIYALIAIVILSLCNLLALHRKAYALLAFIAMAFAGSLYVSMSGRVTDLREGILVSGMASWSNESFKRFGQIFGPLLQFPQIYKPVTVIFATATPLEPLGLLALVVGYGSLPGIIWLAYVMKRNLLFRGNREKPLAIAAVFILLIMASPDLIPCVVALAVLANLRSASPASAHSSLLQVLPENTTDPPLKRGNQCVSL